MFQTRYPDVLPANYKFGMWIWVLHRLTGLFIILYAIIHLFEIMLSQFGPGVFNFFFGLGYSWWIQTLDLLLVAALLFHSMNGLRVMLLDLGIGIRQHKAVFASVMSAGFVAYVFFVLDILPYIIGRPIF